MEPKGPREKKPKAATKSQRSRELYSEEDKNSWYPGTKLDEREKKACRCILQQVADELERYHKLSTKAYAVCLSAITHKKQTAAAFQQRSDLVQMFRKGECTKNLAIRNLPTRLLYAYGKLRENTKKGKSYFSWLPTPAQFFKDPEHYRTSLIRAAEKYQKETRSSVPSKVKSTK